MHNVIGVGLMAFLASFTIYAETPAEQPAAAATATVLDEVLVSGEQPGPGMWKVTNGEHTLWILGTHAPLPKKMTWRSKDVENVIANSQELLTGSSVTADIGFFKGLTLLPSLIGVRNNPDDRKLKDVLPNDLYARWLVLKERYLGNDSSVEKWRPIFAAQELYSKAVEKAGLSKENLVWPVVEKVAKKNKLKFTTPTLTINIPKPRAAIKEFKKTPLDDIDCFTKTIERLETDLDVMRVRANAWSVGDVAALRAMTHVDQASACIEAVMNTQLVQERGYRDVPKRMADAWVAAAKEALEKNASTFAILSIDEIMKADGYVAKLKAQGYSIESP